MLQAQPAEDGARWLAEFDERWPGLRRRAGGLALALLLELGLLMLLLTLGQSVGGGRDGPEALTTVTLSPDAAKTDAPPEPAGDARPRALPPVPAPVPLPVPLTVEPPPLKPALALPSAPPAPTAPADSGKARAVIRDDIAGPMGPPNTGYPGDSQRIAGSGPNGEPLYAARWYREPYAEELRGYLSTAGGPGWALINCRTVPDFRVEDCVLVDQYPDSGGMGRAVLAAAWQFKVRPPQVGGRSMVGQWVRIRITYELNRG